MSANVTVRNAGCAFDLGGRALRIERTFRTFGHEFVPAGVTGIDGFIIFRNAADVVIARRGKLKARGDFIKVDGAMIGGGTIRIESAGTIRDGGTLDVAGDTAGEIVLSAHGDVVLEPRSKTTGRGMSSFRDDRGRFADGGTLEIESLGGNIAVQGPIAMVGTNRAEGGTVLLLASRDVSVERPIDVSGGATSGGDIDVLAGDHVRIAASLDARSRVGGDSGGDVTIDAGVIFASRFDPPGGVVPGGNLVVEHALIDLRGSANDAGFGGGDGGWLVLAAAGNVKIADHVIVHSDGPPNSDEGGGGYLAFTAGDDFSGIPSDGDIELAGIVSARGGEVGGALFLSAGRDIDVTSTIDLSGAYAGELDVSAGRDATIAGPIDVAATRRETFAGLVKITAGSVHAGMLEIHSDINAAAGRGGECQSVELAACTLVVAPGVKVDASCGNAGTTFFNDVIALRGRDALKLGAGSRYLAAPSGHVATIHPPGVTPAVGAGVVFTPTRVDREDTFGYPACTPE